MKVVSSCAIHDGNILSFLYLEEKILFIINVIIQHNYIYTTNIIESELITDRVKYFIHVLYTWSYKNPVD